MIRDKEIQELQNVTVAKGLFYSATLSSSSYVAIPASAAQSQKRALGGRIATEIGRIAEYIGANFYFTHPNQSLVLRTGQGQELLRLNKEDGATYEITLENCDTPQAPPGPHFPYYYDAFDLKPGEPKILIEKCGLPAFGGESSPCEIIWLSKSNSLR
jgi:hypothetical protein